MESQKRKSPEPTTDPEEQQAPAEDEETRKKSRQEEEAAAAAIRAAAAAESSSDEDSDEDAIDLSVPSKLRKDELLQIPFEFFDPKDGDFHSVKQLLHNKLPGLCEGSNLSEITDAIVTQSEVGTLVRVTGTAHVFGFITALPVGAHRASAFWKHIEKSLVARSPPEVREKFAEALQTPKLGLLLSQRVLNIPDHLVPKMYDSFRQDIAWATDQTKATANPVFDMKKFLILAPLTSDAKSAGGGSGKGADLTFVHAEEKYVSQVADIGFNVTFSPKEAQATSGAAAAVVGPRRFRVLVADLRNIIDAVDAFDNALPPLAGAK